MRTIDGRGAYFPPHTPHFLLPLLKVELSSFTSFVIYVMDESHPSNIISLIDIGLSADEHYVQFVPPATFGVIYNSATTDIQVVLANGERSELRRTADKIYALRGLIALRRREERDLDLGTELEDDIIRHILHTFGSLEKLREAVRKFCPLRENAEVLADSWAPCVFPDDGQGTENCWPVVLTSKNQSRRDASRGTKTPWPLVLISNPAAWMKSPPV